MALLLWWTWPVLVLCIWWWADSTQWRWTWLVGFEEGIFGTQWLYCGAIALGEFPNMHPLIAVIWIGSALALAAASGYNRRHTGVDF